MGGNGSLASETWKNASVTELELAFAQDPGSDAYIALCETYLELRRFMEAMVVCKKGMKAHPGAIEAKILLARVYAKQGKYPRALQEMDKIVGESADDPLGYFWRAKIRIDGKDEDGAITDLKRAIDLDDGMKEATALLSARGIEYPEREPEPPPPPPPLPPVTTSQVTAAQPPPMMRPAAAMAPGFAGQPGLGSGFTAPMDPRGQLVNPSGLPMPMPRPSQAPYMARGGYAAPPKPRLEGEEELEELAHRVASQKQEKGSPKTTLYLLIGCVLAVIVGVGLALRHKYVTEGVANLSGQARPLFDEDTYGGYKRAVELYDDILDDYDSSHALTLGRYAHALAVLWGEHGETDRKAKLDEILKKAAMKGPDVSHTAAAIGLAALYGGADRNEAAKAAYEAVQPYIKKRREKGAGPSVADLTLGIIELELGNYETAMTEIGKVVNALPESVRAKVWHGTAAFRAGRLSTAENEYTRALRTSEDHAGARARRALVRIRRGNLDGAGSDVQKFDEFAQKFPKAVSNPDRALIMYARSEAYRAAGEDARAQAAYEEAARIDPANPDFPYGLGSWLLKIGRAEEAIAPLAQAAKMEPHRKAFAIMLAKAESATGKNKAALERLETVLKEEPQNLEAALAKVEVMRARGSDEVEGYLKEVLKWSNRALLARLELAKYYRDAGRKKQASDELEDALKNLGGSVPQDQQALVVLEYGDLKYEAGEMGTALRSYEKAAEWGALDAFYKQAVILYRGDKDQREKGEKACRRYLQAGSSLKYSAQARELCGSG